jgi:hypothetical protein
VIAPYGQRLQKVYTKLLSGRQQTSNLFRCRAV